jgi:hypothetical protein
MIYLLLHHYFPELAEKETRSLRVFEGNEFDLPHDEYAFLESYCNEPGCDCRRVIFNVIARRRGKGFLATIAWGWEEREFYVRWLGDDDPHVIEELKGPSLTMGDPQSDLAPSLVQLVEQVLLKNTDYVERLKRHYRIFKERVNQLKDEVRHLAETKSTLHWEPSRIEKLNSYRFHKVATEMKKEFGTIRKGEEREYLHDLMPIEYAILKFSTGQAKNVTDLKVADALIACLLRIKGYLADAHYDCATLVDPLSMEMAGSIAGTFDPYLFEEIHVMAAEYYDITSKEGLREYFITPVRCLLRILDSLQHWSSSGARGYLDYLMGTLGSIIENEDEKVYFHIRKPARNNVEYR